MGTAGLKIGNLIKGAIGLGVDENIHSAYMFIAQNYVPGDEIFLRVLTWRLHGTKPFRLHQRVLAREAAAARQPPMRLGLLSRSRTARPRRVHAAVFVGMPLGTAHFFLGVWDEVGAMMGIPGKAFAAADDQLYGFHDTGPNKLVKHGCHAMALNENRHEFVPTLWTGDALPGSTIKQVWFEGAHADVGGSHKRVRSPTPYWSGWRRKLKASACCWTGPAFPTKRVSTHSP